MPWCGPPLERGVPLVITMDPTQYFNQRARYNQWATVRLLDALTTLAHGFNHGTCHRSQITAAQTALGPPCPGLDLVYFPQAEQATVTP